jgi:hypothetical protein
VTQKFWTRVSAFLILGAALSTTGVGQGGDTADAVGGPFTGSPVLDVPFSAHATTTLTHTLADGTERTQTATARYYRDALGRVRVEQIVTGLNPATERTTFITIDPDPGDGLVYTLDPKARTARPLSRAVLGVVFNGGTAFAIPVGTSQFRFRLYMAPRSHGGMAESLGSRTIQGVQTRGRRITTAVAIGRRDNNGRLEIVDERWESSELKAVIYARTSDPITGVLEYRLTNISRGEPSPDLFVVPQDYTIDPCAQRDDPCFTSEPMPQANRQGQEGQGAIIK